MNNSILRDLLATDDQREKAAIVAKSFFEKLPTEIAITARQCTLLHWFNQTIIEALVKDNRLIQNSAKEIYKVIASLPFIEILPWGAAFRSLTREGLLRRYILSGQEDLLLTATKLVAPAYRTPEAYGMSDAESFFCYTVAGEAKTAIEILDTLFVKASDREDWSYIRDIIQLQDEAEEFPFTHHLPLREKHWMLRGLVHRLQNELEAAIADYSKAIAVNSTNALTYLLRGTIFAEQKHYQEAINDYNRALQHDPSLVQAYINRGIVQDQQEHYKEAVEDLSQAIRLDLTNHEAYTYYFQAVKKLFNTSTFK